jgi:hypothetical protein
MMDNSLGKGEVDSSILSSSTIFPESSKTLRARDNIARLTTGRTQRETWGAGVRSAAWNSRVRLRRSGRRSEPPVFWLPPSRADPKPHKRRAEGGEPIERRSFFFRLRPILAPAATLFEMRSNGRTPRFALCSSCCQTRDIVARPKCL